jgi:hypothetical protein
LTRPSRFRTGLTVAGVLLVAAGTQVIPRLSLPPVPVATIAAEEPGLPFETRIDLNLNRVAEAFLDATRDQRRVFQAILQEGRQLLHLNLDANDGQGSWAELIGDINQRTEAVGILVPGSSAYVFDENFQKYHQRAADLVRASHGTLAMVVWAAGSFPDGWLQGALSGYDTSLGRELAVFSHQLRAEIDQRLGPDNQVRMVVAGHSFGGAVVGTAERYGLDADAVLHIASVGTGEVNDPYDYTHPTRPRYSMTAPGDLIGFVQGFPSPPGLGHGRDPDEFRCVTRLPTGRLPDDPAATDELGRPLGDRAGDRIGGFSSHSDVFIRGSDAWHELLRVFTGAVPPPPACPPPSGPDPVKVRVLPLAVPRVVTASQCRAGGGLRPGGRHRLPG